MNDPKIDIDALRKLLAMRLGTDLEQLWLANALNREDWGATDRLAADRLLQKYGPQLGI